jgi:hypothetical protein
MIPSLFARITYASEYSLVSFSTFFDVPYMSELESEYDGRTLRTFCRMSPASSVAKLSRRKNTPMQASVERARCTNRVTF